MSGGRVYTALVVDDHVDYRAMFRQILEMHGYEVMEAGSGAEASDTLNIYTFDVMVLDLSLPQIEGEEILLDTYHDLSHDHMKIIVTSAYPERFTSEVLSLTEYALEKPVQIEQFHEIIRQLQGASAAV